MGRRYVVGGYSGDQIDPLVDAMLRDADAVSGGRDRLREVVQALSLRLRPVCLCGMGDEPWHVNGICAEGFAQEIASSRRIQR
jgi:hypothetical protein